MHRSKLFFYLFFIIAIFALALGGMVALSSIQKAKVMENTNAPKKLTYKSTATLHDVPLFLAYARTESEHSIGLSFQKELKNNNGLLFIFKENGKQGIWMKDMNFPIDVLWLDENFRIIFIKTDFSPTSFPETIYPSSPARFVLEIPAGFVRTHQIKIGDTLKTSLK